MALEDVLDERTDVLDDTEAAIDRALEGLEERFLARAPKTVSSYDDIAIVVALLMSSGLEDAVASIPYSRISNNVADVISYTDPTKTVRGVSPRLTERYVRSRINIHASKIQSAVFRAQMLQYDLDKIRESISEVLATTKAHMKTDIMEGVASYERELMADAEDPGDLLVYMGPADKATRPFCMSVMTANKAYTRAQVETLNNHPALNKEVPPNVRSFCGGHGCRHMWAVVSPLWAEQHAFDRY